MPGQPTKYVAAEISGFSCLAAPWESVNKLKPLRTTSTIATELEHFHLALSHGDEKIDRQSTTDPNLIRMASPRALI